MKLPKITLEMEAAPMLQYICILSAMLEAEGYDPALQGMLEDVKDRMMKALTVQLSREEKQALCAT